MMQLSILLLAAVLCSCGGTQPDGPDTLPAPSGLSAVLEGTSAARLEWKDNCQDESGYYLFVKGGAGGPQAMLTLPANTTSYLAEELLPDLVQRYRGQVSLIYLDPPFGTGDTLC